MSEHQSTSKPKEAEKVTSKSESNDTATSTEGASYDFGPGVMAFKSLQAAADDSPSSNSITQLQATVDESIDNNLNGILQLQAMADARATTLTEPIQRQENNTGLPDNLKSGMENLSGLSMDDVKVHRNSDKPAQLQAHAYAQGTDIHLGPGQEKHLPHELGHVVQQKQRRVKPTMQMKGKVNINDDTGLEKEADVMGAKALQMKSKDDKVHNDSNQKIESHLYPKYHSNPISLKNGNTLQLFTIQRQEDDSLVESEKRFYKTEGSPTNNAFPETDLAKNMDDNKVATLHLHVDQEAPDQFLLQQAWTGNVGHTWIALEYYEPNKVPEDIDELHRRYLGVGGNTADPMGFWPLKFKDLEDRHFEDQLEERDQFGGYSKDPVDNFVDGQMVHPDREHNPIATYSFEITKEQMDAVISYSESKKGAKYSLFYYNCTTFAKEAAIAAGQAPPSSAFRGGGDYPKKLWSSIKSRMKAGDKKAKTGITHDERAATANITEIEDALDLNINYAAPENVLANDWELSDEMYYGFHLNDNNSNGKWSYDGWKNVFFYWEIGKNWDDYYEPDEETGGVSGIFLPTTKLYSKEEFNTAYQLGFEEIEDSDFDWEEIDENTYRSSTAKNGKWWFYFVKEEEYQFVMDDETGEESEKYTKEEFERLYNE